MFSYRPLRRSWRAALAAATSALMLVAFAMVGISPAQAQGIGAVAGTVTNGAGNPVADLHIVVADHSGSFSAVTDASGAYLVSGVPSGGYSVSVSDLDLLHWDQTRKSVDVAADDTTVVDFVLEVRPNFVLRGQVTNQATGDPVPNHQVTVWGPDFTLFHPLSVYTDASGFYEITHIPVPTVTVGAAESDAEFKTWQMANVAVGSEPTVLNINLHLKPTGIGAVSGVVLERGTSTPIEGANVSARNNDGYLENLTTGRDGSFAFTGIPFGEISLSATGPWSWPAPPVYQNSAVSVTLSASVPTRTRDLLLKRAPVGVSVVSGAITESDGAGGSLPLADFFVSAMSTDMTSPGGVPVITDAAGHFSIGNLAKGSYYLSVTPREYGLLGAFKGMEYSKLAFTVDGVNPITKNLEMVRFPTGTGSISGVLTDRRTGAPIGGAMASILGLGGHISRTTYTDTLGRWSIENLPDGEYELGITSFQHEYQWTWPRFTITDGGHVDQVGTLNSVAAGTASLSGRVKNFITHEGVAAASIRVDRIEGGFEEQSVLADGKGDYTVANLPHGSYRVMIEAENFESSFGAVDIAAREAATYTGRLVPTDPIPTGEGMVTGFVTDAFGDPIDRAMVSVSAGTAGSLGLRGWASATTDADGQFELDGLALTRLSVTVNAMGYASATSTVTLAADSAAHALDFVLQDEASLSGIVTTEAGTSPVGVQAMLYSPDGQPWWGALVEENGTYEVSGLPSGDYIVRLFQSNEVSDGSDIASLTGAYWKAGSTVGTQNRADATVVTLAAGDHSLAHDIRLKPGGKIAGTIRVATADGTTALPQGKSVKVTAHKLESGVWKPQELAITYAYSGSNGKYELLGLAPGSYKLQFSDDWTGNRAYTTMFNGGVASLADAPVITVSASATSGGIDAAMSVPMPGTASAAVTTAELGASTEGQLVAPSGAANGEEITVNVGRELAGEFVSVWAHSTPTSLTGWVKVASDGTIKATLASSLPVGQHHLVVQDAENAVVGWSQIAVAAASKPVTTAPGTDTGAGSGTSTGASSGSTTAAPRSARPTASTPTPALEAITETFQPPKLAPAEPDVVEETTPDDEAAVESTATEAIADENGGPNWALLLGILAGVIGIGAIGGVIATVRARRA